MECPRPIKLVLCRFDILCHVVVANRALQVGCPRLLEMCGVISLYKPTTTLQPESLGRLHVGSSDVYDPEKGTNVREWEGLNMYYNSQ